MMWQSAPTRRNGSGCGSAAAGENWFSWGGSPVPPDTGTPPRTPNAVAEAGVDVDLDADADSVPLERLEAEICSQAGAIAASTAAWLRLVAQFDRRKGWAQWGIKSCAHWLTWACSVAPGAAREYVRVASALVDLPLLDAAFAAGRLSYSKVRAVTRVADRVAEQTLLDQALVHTASQLERVVRGYRKADGAGADQQRLRRARWYFDEDGMLLLSARLPADEGAIVVAALEQARQGGGVDGSKEDAAEQPTAEQEAGSAADALVMLAQDALAAGPGDSSGDDRHLLVLHVDAAVLTSDDGKDEVPDGGPCRIENGPGVERATAERIACDASLLALINSALPGQQLRLGRKTRKISPAQRRALRIRDGGCMFPGCHRRRHLEAHHVTHWLRGGVTDLDNLVLLCRRHHMAIHEEGFTVAWSTPSAAHANRWWQFYRPDGVPIPRSPQLTVGSDASPVPDPIIVDEFDPERIRSGWRGERFSLADSVAVFCQSAPSREGATTFPPR